MELDPSLKQELLGLENKYWQAMKENDVETMLELSDDPCLLAGASGVTTFDKESMKKMMGAELNYKLLDFSLTDAEARSLTDDTAVIAYKVKEKLIVDGKPVEFEAADASTWVRKEGKWVCALHTESIAGDAFGRDRRAKTASH